MNEDLRRNYEAKLIKIVEKQFPDVREVQFNSKHLNPNGRMAKQDCYFFINKGWNSRLNDIFVPLEAELYRDHGLDIVSLQLPFAPKCERVVYSREQ